MEPGKFIVLEGIDGAGTSTQAALLTQYLFEKDKKNVVTLTREPTKLSPYGLELRRRLMGNLLPEETLVDEPDYWTALFVNDRKWHLNHVVQPAINAGLQVVSDRYKLSTLAYQSVQGMDLDELMKLHEGLHIPDLTFLVDVPVDVAMQRMGKDQQRTPEYFDSLAVQQQVRQNYLLAAQKLSDKEKIVIIDGSKSIENVAKVIQQEVNKLYGYQ